MPIKVELMSAYAFTRNVNAVIFSAAFALVIFANGLQWDSLSSIAYFITFTILLTIVYQPQKKQIRYFTLVEGEIGKCSEFDSTIDHPTGLVLIEHKCRISPIGCWLVFATQYDESNKTYDERSFPERIVVFLPKHHLLSTDYKSICRHLIWHSG